MKKFSFALIAVLAIGIAGCGGDDDASREDAGDAPAAAVDKTQPRVIAFNNHYPNVEMKCDGYGHRIYVQTHDSATGRNMLVIADPKCPGWTPQTAAGMNSAGE